MKFWRKKDQAADQAVAVEPEVIESEEVLETQIPVADVITPQELVKVELPKRNLSKGFKAVFSRIKFDVENLEELEDVLIQADFGVTASETIVSEVKAMAKKSGAKTETELKGILTELLTQKLSRTDASLNLDSGKQPYVILVVGVNGAGKTTTIGKLANYLVEGGAKVTLGAADTFRAAAVEQLETWASRSGSEIVKPVSEGQDPAAVAYETVERAIANGSDVLIIDTAGRLQNKQGLMDELGKIRRVIEKQLPISEVLLVLDSTTGQNAMTQAKAFTEVASVTGIALTKLDGSAKGGIVYAIQEQLNIPVKLVGVGEGINDFGFFDAKDFAIGLVGEY
ncbi:MAG: signal recognition particle-docking protein FtsY [Rhodoluna sp.]|nr:signal recognition particle-docking protein FtsY [Rhodoluna sp.]